ncbi:uncharacterized protein [Venturia canescens]|uniref:uncharacterized protein n=1 Tax=Venturia canescens TaxID=32260 RepID=UPI001C9CEA86|nr:uncharacterized protein LOC122407629 [Venturia canescens]
MSLQDGIFAEEVENDITLFAENARRKRVLIFPPVNNYRRFIIHQLVQDRFSDLLKTFSIGQGPARRTVVCYQSDVLRDPKLNGVPSRTCVELTDSRPLDSACGAMRVEEARRPPENSASPEHSKMRQVKMSPAVEIYRPPAARRASKDGQLSSTGLIHNDSASSSSAKANRQRRPDRAVYVPKHRRSTEAEESGNGQIADEIISPACRSRCNRTRTSSPSLENDSFRKHVSPHDHDRNEHQHQHRNSGGSWDKKSISSMRSSSRESRSKSDERGETSEEVESVLFNERTRKPPENYSNETCHEFPEHRRNEVFTEIPSLSQQKLVDGNLTNTCSNVPFEKNDESLESNDQRRNSDFDMIPELDSSSSSSSSSNSTVKDPELTEPLDSHKQTNNKNLSVPIPCNVSNVLIISDPKEHEKNNKMINVDKENTTVISPPEKKPKKVARVKSKPASPPSPPIKLNRDECDWDSLFDDNGECLDPTLIEELTAAVGEVTIEQPKNDYKAFSRPVEVSSDEFGHVIEIYNFPSDFKTCDLAAVFSPWKNGGFELKWVDDTHCLGVFSSPLVAAEVLGSDHPFVKTRPLSAATSLSKTKARKSVEFLQPYKSRPQTCAALARRLVTGALGLKLATARQEREQEKLLLREAKEKRRLANKQREDVWEGIITEK